MYKPRKGTKPKGFSPAYPHGVPSPPERGGGRNPRATNKKPPPTRAAPVTPVNPRDPFAFGWLRRLLLNCPDARNQFFGRTREKVDRFHAIVKPDRRTPARTPTGPPRRKEKRQARVPEGVAPALDQAKVAPLVEFVRPIRVFNPQNHEPGSQTKPESSSRASRKARQDRRLVTLSNPKRSGNLKHPAPQWIAHHAGSGVMSGFTAANPNKAAHALNGNIAAGAGAVCAISGSSRSRSRSPVPPTSSGTAEPGGVWTRALLDTGADCSICPESFDLGRFTPLSSLPSEVQHPYSSQGGDLNITGVREVTLRMGLVTFTLQFWVSRSARRPIVSLGELLRKGFSCQMISLPANLPASAAPRMTGAIYCDRAATHIEWENDHLWVYLNNRGVFFEGEMPPHVGSEPPTIRADTHWDVRVLLDSGSNVHTCPAAWIPEQSRDSGPSSTSASEVLVDAARREIPCAGFRRTHLDVGGVAGLDVRFVVTPTVNEVILSVGALLRQGVSLHLTSVDVREATSAFVHVGTIEIGTHRARVTLKHNTTWITAVSGCAWPPRPSVREASSPTSPTSGDMDDTDESGVLDSADAGDSLDLDSAGSVGMMECASVQSDLQDGPPRDDDLSASQIIGAWDMSGPPCTQEFLQACSTPTAGQPVIPSQNRDPDDQDPQARGSTEVAVAGPSTQVEGTPSRRDIVLTDAQWVAQEPALIPELARERRHMPGAATSDRDFTEFFNSCEAAGAKLDKVEPTKPNVGYSISKTAARVIALAAEGIPGASYHFIRMAAVCLITAQLRLPDYTLREHVLIVWILEGGHRIRAHEGFCYIYHDDGAFQEYRHGVTPEATIGHLKDQLRTVEGIFRKFPKKSIDREDSVILKEINDLLHLAGSEQALIASCHKECLEAGAAYGFKRKGSEVEALAPEDGAEPPKRDEYWCRTTAGIVLRVSQTLMREITRDEFMQYIIHWCDRPRQSRMGVAYSDKAVLYTSTAEQTDLVTLADSNPDTGLYVRVPHPLLDPVLAATTVRLRKYYQESFWTNFRVFKCLLAAQALAKRGLNVDRLFIGLSPGGVGQSLYTSHLAAIYGKGNHVYYDPNIWCLEEELRKQAEHLSCGMILTGQETPTGARGIREDLYKRFITSEPVAARRPYGHETLMLRIVGWKRLEANRHLSFTGVTEKNFNSILRRSFAFEINSRFVESSHLTKANYTEHGLDGIYPSDPSLHQFVVSTQAVGAAIKIQHAFESMYSQADCLRLIDEYCNQGGDLGYTEKTMRVACGLPLRAAGGDTDEAQPQASVALRQAVEAEDLATQQVPFGVSPGLESLAHRVIKYMLLHSKFSITPASIGSVKATGWSDAELWQALTAKKLLFSVNLQGKGDNKHFPSMQPCKAEELMDKVALSEEDRIVKQSQQFQERWAISNLENYANSTLRLANKDVMLATLDAILGNVKRGKAKQTRAEEDRIARLLSARRKLQAFEERTTRLLRALSTSTTKSPSKKRSTKKQPEAPVDASAGDQILQRTLTYRYTLSMFRTRRQVDGTGAQTLSRVHCRVLLPDTIDLDIQNCCFSILRQMIDKVNPRFFPDAERECLERCADDRAGVCKQMDVPLAEGKVLLNSVLNGQSVSDSQKGCKFLKTLQRTSRCVRWLAAEVVPEVTDHLKEEATRINPYASIVFFWWSAFESLILDEWAQFISTSLGPVPSLAPFRRAPFVEARRSICRGPLQGVRRPHLQEN